MTFSIHDFRDYKAYLKAWIAQRPGGGRGEKTHMAKHLRCHNTYLTQVLEKQAELSPEQAESLNAYLGHSAEESRYFFLLVQHRRAGTTQLRKFLAGEIDALLERRQLLKDRLTHKSELTEQDQARYYGAWYYAAIHLAVGIPPLNTAEALARALELDRALVREALDFLEAKGLVRAHGAGFVPGPTSLHLGRGSPMLARHHSNWRMQSLRALDRSPEEGLHYSSVITLSREDVPRAKEILIRAIEEVRAVVRPSESEELCCYTVDFFGLTR